MKNTKPTTKAVKKKSAYIKEETTIKSTDCITTVEHYQSLQFWEEPKQLEKIKQWVAQGDYQVDIAERIGVSANTLSYWKRKSKAICDALADGKNEAQLIVENSFFRRSVGYDVVETTRVFREGRLYEERQSVRHIPPDTNAAIKWLERYGTGWTNNATVTIVLKGDADEYSK